MLHKRWSIPRGALAALALVAVALLLLRPACDLRFAHAGAGAAPTHAQTFAVSAPIEHGGAPAEQCCASAGYTNLVAPLHAASGAQEGSQGLVPAALVAVVAGTAILSRQSQWLRAPPRSPQSFYLRSTRITR